MNERHRRPTITRRALLRSALGGSALTALAPSVPGFLLDAAHAAGAGRDARILVVIQLDGGNDGVNTVVPFKDEGYARNRAGLRLRAGELVAVDGDHGLHPAMADAGGLLESGRLAIVQGVAYPNPSQSHFASMDIWHTARPSPRDRGGAGWIGLALDADAAARAGVPGAVAVGDLQPPLAVRGRRSVASGLTRPEDCDLARAMRPALGVPAPAAGTGLEDFLARSSLDAYSTADRMAEVLRAPDGGPGYPKSQLAGQLRLVARLIKSGAGSRVYYAAQAGYDTHAGQLPAHAALLGELSSALRAFLDDLAAAGLADRVLVLAFSEFGRRARENGAAGTDHGTAGPVLLAGPGVRPGLAGATPRLDDLDEYGNLKWTIDFRRVYAAALEGWLGLPSAGPLGGRFEPLPILRG